MILQRLMKAVREQNWFAVVLELVIVILGIVIGFQITASNENRDNQASEVQLVERLHGEIMSLQANRWDWTVELGSTRDSLLSASQKLYGEVDEDLTAAECSALVLSHVFNSPSLTLPVIAELESTGDLDLIGNRDVRAAITLYLQANTWASEMDVALNHEILNLAPDYPELFHFVPPAVGADWNPAFDGSARCDTVAMRTDRAFLNALADNISKANFYRTVMTNVAESFAALHTTVDAELGLTHTDDE